MLMASSNPGYNLSESTIHTPRSLQIAINIKPVVDATPPNPCTEQFPIYTGILYVVYAATLLYMFPSLIALVGLKFQNKAQSPFETHSILANVAVVAYIFAIPMPVALYCLKARLASSSMEQFPHICYRILQGVFYFWSLLAPLSFVLVLFLPHGFDLIGYSVIFTLFVVVVACSLRNYICKKDASNLEAHERNEA